MREAVAVTTLHYAAAHERLFSDKKKKKKRKKEIEKGKKTPNHFQLNINQ